MTERERERADVVAGVAEHAALLNEFRTDAFQDEVVRLVNNARELWRDAGGELPRRGADPLLDALNTIADVADSSPIAVRDACADAMRRAGEDAKVAR
jgi:hypothetical protein